VQPESVDAAAATASSAIPQPSFEVRADSTDLTYFWFDQFGVAHGVTSISEIPADRRERVRVDPMRPEQRTPGWVYVADLRQPGSGGVFALRTVSAETFAEELNPALIARRAEQQNPATDPANPQVIVYGASWCGACQQAKAWLRSQGIAYVEHDIEREPEAARQLTTQAQQQGVPTGSIPIISVRGRLFVGFNPATINQALGRS
jgi:arsenate reductase-like glutaredoxin family protein